MSQRSGARVPRALLVLLAGTLVAQVLLRGALGPSHPRSPALRHPPARLTLHAAALGDPVALARGLTLWLQALDYRDGASFALHRLDYPALSGWLDRILSLDPRSEYPLRLALMVYANTSHPEKARVMLEFAYAKSVAAPERRWRWLAVAALHARHRLADPLLALKYARALAECAPDPAVAAWARALSLRIERDSAGSGATRRGPDGATACARSEALRGRAGSRDGAESGDRRHGGTTRPPRARGLAQGWDGCASNGGCARPRRREDESRRRAARDAQFRQGGAK